MARKKKWNFSTRLLSAMMSVMLVSILAMGVISAVLYAGSMSRELSLTRTNTLQQTTRYMTATLKSIEQKAVEKSIDRTFVNSIFTIASNDMMDIYNMVYLLREFKNDSWNVSSIYLYLPKQRSIITSNDGFWREEDFYDTLVKIEGAGDKNILWYPLRSVTDNTGLSSSVISFTLRIPNTENIGEVFLQVNLSAEKLAELLQPWDTAQGEETFIVDRDGKIICSTSSAYVGKDYKDQSFEKNYLVTMNHSMYNDWLFINIVPKSYIMLPIIKSLGIIALISAFFIVVGSVAVGRVSAGIYRPIGEIIGEFKENLYNQNIIIDDTTLVHHTDAEYLKMSIRSMLEQNKTLRERASDNVGDHRREFLNGLFTGLYPVGYDYQKKMDELQIGFSFQDFYVALLRIDLSSLCVNDFSPADCDLLSYGVENIAGELLGEKVEWLAARLETDATALLIASSGSCEIIKSLMETIRLSVFEALKITLTITISERFSNIGDASQAWDACQELWTHRLELGSCVIVDGMVMRTGEVSLPIMDQITHDQIVSYIRQGNTADFSMAIDHLIDDIRSRPIPSIELVHAAMLTILGDIVSIVGENGWKSIDIFGRASQPYRELVNRETLKDMGEYLKEVQMVSSTFMLEEREVKNKNLLNKVTQYIQSHYNEDLRLNTVAENVYMSPSYLSRLFKQEIGKNFLEYLTEVRVEKSKELLLDPNLRLAEIAKKTQFGTANNFIKVFKKYEGITPGQYRKQLALEGLDADMNREYGDDEM